MKAFSLLYQRSHFIQQAVSNVILNKKWLKPLYTVLSLLHTKIALYLIKSMVTILVTFYFSIYFLQCFSYAYRFVFINQNLSVSLRV